MTYTFYYWPNLWPFKKPLEIPDVVEHWVDDMTSQVIRSKPDYEPRTPLYWAVKTQSGKIRFIPFTCAVELREDHVEVVLKKMSQEVGQQVQRKP